MGIEGNKFALGNKGGGRKSAYQERASAQALIDIWEGKYSEQELKEIIKSGKYGAMHIFAAKAMSGDVKVLNKIADKLYANRQTMELGGDADKIDEALAKINNLMSDAKAEAETTTEEDTASDELPIEPVSV